MTCIYTCNSALTCFLELGIGLDGVKNGERDWFVPMENPEERAIVIKPSERNEEEEKTRLSTGLRKLQQSSFIVKKK